MDSVLSLWQSAGLFDAICIAVLLLSIALVLLVRGGLLVVAVEVEGSARYDPRKSGIG